MLGSLESYGQVYLHRLRPRNIRLRQTRMVSDISTIFGETVNSIANYIIMHVHISKTVSNVIFVYDAYVSSGAIQIWRIYSETSRCSRGIISRRYAEQNLRNVSELQCNCGSPLSLLMFRSFLDISAASIVATDDSTVFRYFCSFFIL